MILHKTEREWVWSNRTYCPPSTIPGLTGPAGNSIVGPIRPISAILESTDPTGPISTVSGPTRPSGNIGSTGPIGPGLSSSCITAPKTSFQAISTVVGTPTSIAQLNMRFLTSLPASTTIWLERFGPASPAPGMGWEDPHRRWYLPISPKRRLDKPHGRCHVHSPDHLN